MQNDFKPEERELIRVVNYFKKRSRQLIEEGKLSEVHSNVEQAVDRFVQHLALHAEARTTILAQREELRKVVRDNAECPKCAGRDMLKQTAVEENEKGWKSNRYKCRRCNILFTWNRPNNPWDMVGYFEEVLLTLQLKIADATATPEEKQYLEVGVSSLTAYLDKMKPVLAAHDREYQDYLQREEEMSRLVHEFKNSLLIEKIKMEAWDKP